MVTLLLEGISEYNRGYAWSKNLKSEANFLQNICSMVNQLSDLLIKQPEEHEVDDTAPGGVAFFIVGRLAKFDVCCRCFTE